MSVLTDLANVLKQDVAKDVLPVLLTDIQQVAANPDLILNPVSQPVEFAKLTNDLLQAVSPSGQFAKDVVADVLNLAVTYIQNIKIPLAQKAKAGK